MLLCLGACHSGDPCCGSAVGIWYPRTPIFPQPGLAECLAVLVGPSSGGSGLGVFLWWFDAPGSHGTWLGMAAWNWSYRLRADVGKRSLSGFRHFLLPGWAGALFSRSIALS